MLKFFASRIATALACACVSLPSLAATDIKLVNPSFEEPANGARTLGWFGTQHYGPNRERDYEWSVDAETASDGKASYRIRRKNPQVYGMIAQGVVIEAHAGKTLELSAMMKTDDVGPDGWVLVVNVEDRKSLVQQVRSTPATGKHDFKRYSVRFKLPPEAYELKIGVMLLDAGTGWVDDVKLRVVD
jgi:hypothetical protein